MPTTVAKVVDHGNSAGTDYLSWNAYENAFGGTTGDLDGDDAIAKCELRCSDGYVYPYIFTDGWAVSDSAHYLWIYVPPAYRHTGSWPTSGNIVRVNSAAGIYALSIYIINVYFRCSGLACRPINNTNTYCMIFLEKMHGSWWEDCLLDGGNLAGHPGHSVYGEACFILSCTVASGPHDMRCDNCVFPQWGVYDGAYTTKLHYIGSSYNRCLITLNSCTCDSFQAGMLSDSSGANTSWALLRDCVFFNMPAIIGSAMVYHADCDANAWDGTSFGTNFVDITGMSAADLFVDHPDDFTPVADCALTNAGTNLTSLGITTDMLGTARPASGNWDIGVIELDNVPPTPPPTAQDFSPVWFRFPRLRRKAI